MVKTVMINLWEFVRFILTGVTATVGNFAAVWFARLFVSFEIALLAGILAGLTISFILSKLFAFRSHSWNGTGGEATRFLVVYALSCAVYWGVAMLCGRLALSRGLAPQMAEMGGVIVGAGTMTLTSYLGHRFFTYRTHRRAAQRRGGAS
jgi:putative flippase GtrA